MRDVLLATLGSTFGLRAAEDELAASLRRAGASVEVARPRPPREVRTFALTDLAWALAARRAAAAAPAARATIYTTTTAALLWPRPGAIRFDAPAAANRPGRHGLWQRPVEARRIAAAPLLIPQDAGALAEAGLDRDDPRAVVLPIPVEPSGPPEERDLAAVTYATNPAKKGLDVVLAAWAAAAREGEELVVAGVTAAEAATFGPAARTRFVGRLEPHAFRALLRRARVYVTAPRREDYGLVQLEALADGCRVVTTPAPGPYAALPLLSALDPQLVATPDALARALRHALDARDAWDPLPALAPFRRAAADAVVADVLLPRLLTPPSNVAEWL